MEYRQLLFVVSCCAVLLQAAARPDGGDQPPLPGPGLSYGGIPYGSVSGNVAEFFGQAPSSGHARQLASNALNSDYAPSSPYL